MWIFCLLIPSFVLAGSASIAILCRERRPMVLLCLGGMVGLVATSIALSWLGLLVGIANATWMVFVLLVCGGLAAAVYWWRSRLLQTQIAVSWKYVVLLLALALHFGVVAAVSWQFAVGAGVELDSLFAHSAFTSTISRGNFPVANPYQPDQLLTYRLTYHLLGAFVVRLADQPAPEALTLLNAALYNFVFLGAVGMGLAARLGPRRTLLAAVLFLTVGDFQWLPLSQLANLGNSDYNHHTLVTAYLRDSVGPALANGLNNVSLTYGYLVLFCGLTLYIYGRRATGWRRTSLALTSGVVLGHLAAANETWFAALGVALLVDLAIRTIFIRRVAYDDMLRGAGAIAALVVTAITSPGILFAGLLGGVKGDPGLQFKGSHILHYRSDRLDTDGWLPLLHTDFLWLWGLLLIAVPFVLLYVWYTRHHLSWLLLLYCGACFSAFFLFTVEHAVDMWRFLYSGIAALAFVTGLAAIWFLSALRSFTAPARFSASLVLLCAALLYIGGFITYSLALPWLADPRPPVAYRKDKEAVEVFLIRNTAVQERLLVLGDATHWNYPLLPFSQQERAALSAYVAAYSGQYLPTGGLFGDRIGYSVDSPQLRRANAAQGRLSDVDLQKLDIIYLYASEPWLNQVQRAALAEKLARGSLLQVWRKEDTAQPPACRAFLRLNESGTNEVAAVSFNKDEKVALPSAPLRLQLPLLRAAADASGKTATKDDMVQASILISVSEPTTVRVENGSGYSLRMPVDEALAVRTPPLEPDTTLKIHTEGGVAQVLWIEAYPPIGRQEAVYLPENLELCGVYE